MIAELLQHSVNGVPYGLRRYVARIPVLAAIQRSLVARFLTKRPFLHTVNAGPAKGLHYEITLPLDKAIWTGTYEQAFARVLADCVRPGDVCYDIGGYRGYMSAVMALAGAVKVIVFEPLPANQQALRRLCDLNPTLPIELLPLAVGRRDGEAVLEVMPELSMGKLASSPFQTWARLQDEIHIQVRRIDDLVARSAVPAPKVIKIDVEGAEFDVLEGARNTLRQRRPIILLEAHSPELELTCTGMLQELGYRLRRVGGETPTGTYPVHLHAHAAA